MHRLEILSIVGVVVAVVALIILGVLAATGVTAWSSAAAIATAVTAILLLILSAGYLIYRGTRKSTKSATDSYASTAGGATAKDTEMAREKLRSTLLSMSTDESQSSRKDVAWDRPAAGGVSNILQRSYDGSTGSSWRKDGDNAPAERRLTRSASQSAGRRSPRSRVPLTDDQLADVAAELGSWTEGRDVASLVSDERAKRVLSQLQEFGKRGKAFLKEHPEVVDALAKASGRESEVAQVRDAAAKYKAAKLRRASRDSNKSA